jgi:hypothetical protein
MPPDRDGRGNGTKSMGRKDLGALLEAARPLLAVSLPREKFRAVVTLALEAARSRQSPAYSALELDAMLAELGDEPMVTREGDEMRHLLTLAMCAATLE